ncbi:MAG: undecaprenyl-phosphate glucose phosphotransferase [Marinicaulis sp.]|nr:undecaprenyl-phosphate glucose phosphotransferase [Marinicaulis sp.]
MADLREGYMVNVEAKATDEFSRDGVRKRSSVTRALFGDVLQLVDFALLIASSVLVAYVYHRFALGSEFDFQKYAAAGIVGATGLTALLRRDGYYEFDQVMSQAGAIRAITSRWILVVLGLLAFVFALKISDNFSRVWLFTWSVSAVSLVLAAHAIAAAWGRRLSRDGGLFSRRIAVVGATDLAEKFAQHVGSPDNGIYVVGIYSAGLPNNGDDLYDCVKGDLNDLAIAARAGEIDDIVVTAPRTSPENMEQLLRRLSILPVSISLCANVHWLDHTGGAVANVGGAKVLSLYRRPLEGWGGVLKNAEDFVLGAIALVIASPVLLTIALAIKLQGKGPILFAQQRHGFNNAVFRIYKFRTMTVAEDGDIVTQASEGDARITPLGKFLRRYSLDELPQLINVVRGEMSLVGPRPHALAHNHQYALAIKNYSGRHKVKPGITGWAQVNGLRGETSENELMEQRVQYDLSYIDNWSIWFDLKILLLTVWAVLYPKNAV